MGGNVILGYSSTVNVRSEEISRVDPRAKPAQLAEEVNTSVLLNLFYFLH
jgi:hypothetical protein